MLTNRDVIESDIDIICQFPRNKIELFNIFPAATFPLDYKQLKGAIDNRFSSTVFLLDGQIVGFANLYSVKQGETAGIGNVIIAPKHRGKGIGRYIIETMIDIGIKKYSLKRINIACMSNNFPGLFLYTKIGFKPTKIDSLTDPTGTRVARIHFVYEVDNEKRNAERMN